MTPYMKIKHRAKVHTSMKQAAWILFLSIMYLLRDLAKLPFPDIAFSGVAAVAFLFTDAGSAMGIYLFTSALTVPDMEIRFAYLLVLLGKAYFQKKKLNVPVLLASMAMLTLELLDIGLFSENSWFGAIYKCAERISYVVLPVFWLSENHSPTVYHRALLCYVAGVVLGGATMLIISIGAVGWDGVLSGKLRLGMNTTQGYYNASSMHTGYNANQLASMYAITVAIAFGMIRQKKIQPILGYMLVAFSALMVLLTQSRSGLLMLCLAGIVYLWYLIVREKKMLQASIALGVFIVIIIVLTFTFPGLWEGALKRFINPGDHDITGGRGDLFREYIVAWFSNPWCILFGYGIESYQYVVDSINVPHNIITDILISWGLTGFFLLFYTWRIMLRYGTKKVMKKKRVLALLPAIVAAIYSMSGQYLSTAFPHMRLCFLLLAARAFSDEDLLTAKRSKRMLQ